MTEYSSSLYAGTAVEIAKQFEIDHPDVEFSIDGHDNARLTFGESTFIVGTEYDEDDEDRKPNGYTFSVYSSSEDLAAQEPAYSDGDTTLDTLPDMIASWYADQK